MWRHFLLRLAGRQRNDLIAAARRGALAASILRWLCADACLTRRKGCQISGDFDNVVSLEFHEQCAFHPILADVWLTSDRCGKRAAGCTSREEKDGGDSQVAIKGPPFAFDPSSLTIKAGDTVEFD
jgi:hypothetical protein